jgi:hypothetical protein
LIRSIAEFDGMGLTELVTKLSHAERELLHERSRRQEAEACMQQVLRDVEKKAPIIASQRRDYMRSGLAQGWLDVAAMD